MHRRSDDSDDRGSSLVETLVAAALIALVSAAVAAASSTASSTSRRVLEDLDTTRDATRIRERIGKDLATYSNVDTSPSRLSNLPGTNAFALSDMEPMSGPSQGASEIVSYRYLEIAGSWRLERFEVPEESARTDQATRTSIASGLADPPQQWSPGEAVSHAVAVTDSQGRRVVDIAFSSGRRLRTRAIASDIPESPPTTVTQQPPTVPTQRCGGSITIVLNTANTIWSRGEAATVTGDLTNFVDGLVGTPTHIHIVAFDRSAYSFYPDSISTTSLDLLNTSSSLDTLRSNLVSLSITSSKWRNGRNWEDGLWLATRRDSGQLYAQVPDLVVFITDGSPNRNRTTSSIDPDTTFHAVDLSRAVAAADYARNTGARLIGVLMGSGADATAAEHLETVFGSSTWDGSSDVLPADRVRSFIRPAAEGFSKLDEVLRLVSRWRCAGTVTVQQRLLVQGVPTVPSQSWAFDIGSDDSSRSYSSIVHSYRLSSTADFGVGNIATSRSVTISQDRRSGFRHNSTSCSRAGSPIPVTISTDEAGRTSSRITISAADTATCVLTAEALP